VVLSAVIASQLHKSLSDIEFCGNQEQAVSDSKSGVNSIRQRRSVSPKWDSRTRPAKRQHHRCIGCEKKTLLDLSGLWPASEFGKEASLRVGLVKISPGGEAAMP